MNQRVEKSARYIIRPSRSRSKRLSFAKMEDIADEKMRLCDENEEYRDYIVSDTEDDEEEQQKKVKDLEAQDFPTPKKDSKRRKSGDGEKNPREEHRHWRRSKK
jgi:hypothetical protein